MIIHAEHRFRPQFRPNYTAKKLHSFQYKADCLLAMIDFECGKIDRSYLELLAELENKPTDPKGAA